MYVISVCIDTLMKVRKADRLCYNFDKLISSKEFYTVKFRSHLPFI